ncbi:hypothetical protein GGF32_003400 [Allomyces javanicus]|nr:hypothetical protein GGF32_003400 [Allomyces javanicus]
MASQQQQQPLPAASPLAVAPPNATLLATTANDRLTLFPGPYCNATALPVFRLCSTSDASLACPAAITNDETSPSRRAYSECRRQRCAPASAALSTDGGIDPATAAEVCALTQCASQYVAWAATACVPLADAAIVSRRAVLAAAPPGTPDALATLFATYKTYFASQIVASGAAALAAVLTLPDPTASNGAAKAVRLADLPLGICAVSAPLASSPCDPARARTDRGTGAPADLPAYVAPATSAGVVEAGGVRYAQVRNDATGGGYFYTLATCDAASRTLTRTLPAGAACNADENCTFGRCAAGTCSTAARFAAALAPSTPSTAPAAAAALPTNEPSTRALSVTIVVVLAVLVPAIAAATLAPWLLRWWRNTRVYAPWPPGAGVPGGLPPKAIVREQSLRPADPRMLDTTSSVMGAAGNGDLPVYDAGPAYYAASSGGATGARSWLIPLTPPPPISPTTSSSAAAAAATPRGSRVLAASPPRTSSLILGNRLSAVLETTTSSTHGDTDPPPFTPWEEESVGSGASAPPPHAPLARRVQSTRRPWRGSSERLSRLLAASSETGAGASAAAPAPAVPRRT